MNNVSRKPLEYEYECHTKSEKEEINVQYTWVIHHFKLQPKEERLNSSTFSVPAGMYDWYLDFLNDDSSSNSLFCVDLNLEKSAESIKKFGPVSGKAAFWFIDSKGEKRVASKPLNFVLRRTSNSFLTMEGIHKYADLFNEQNGFLKQGQLRILFEFSFILLNSVTITHADIPKQFHAYEYIPSFEKLYNNDEYCDVEIYVKNNKKYLTHKLVLISSSSVFKAMFAHDMKESQQNRININDISEECLGEMLRFIYTGKVKNIKSTVFELFQAADKYNIEELKNLCIYEMYKMLSAETVVKILILSDAHGLHNLKARAFQYFRMYSDQVMLAEDWIDFTSRPDLVRDAFSHLL